MDATLMILLWHRETAVVIVPMEGALGGRMLPWLDRRWLP